MPTFMKKIKTVVVLVELEFEYREKLSLKCFLRKFWDYQNSNAKAKTMIFLVKHSSTMAVFLFEILIDEIELVMAEN